MIMLESRTVDNSVPITKHPASSDSFERGEALKLSGGKLTKCGAGDEIEFISEETRKTSEGDLLTVTPVAADGVYVSYLAEDLESVNPGELHLLDSAKCVGALGEGHIRILSAEGLKAGDKVRFNIV